MPVRVNHKFPINLVLQDLKYLISSILFSTLKAPLNILVYSPRKFSVNPIRDRPHEECRDTDSDGNQKLSRLDFFPQISGYVHQWLIVIVAVFSNSQGGHMNRYVLHHRIGEYTSIANAKG